MKNMKKLLQKAMAFTLAAAMLVGMPMSASAAGLVDLYSIQKPGMEVDPEHDVNTSGTGTVTNTETGSGILTDNEGKIKGIVLDRETVEAEKGINETLTAEIILDGDLVGNDGAVIENQEEAIRKLSEKITWKLGKLNANGEFVQDTSLSQTLGIKVDTENNNVDRRVLTLIPKKGTVAGKEIYVQASINSSYYIKDGKVEEYVNDIGEVKALAKVSIKEYTGSLTWKWAVPGSNVEEPKPYVNHAIDLSKYLVRNPETANDTITWAISSQTKGVATITPAGVVTIKKANESFTVYAMGERCDRLAWSVAKTDAGVPATKVEIYEVDANGNRVGDGILKSKSVDVGENGKNEGTEIKVKAKLIATKKVVLGSDGNPAITEKAADDAKAANGKYRVGNKPLTEGDLFIEADKAGTALVTPTGASSPVQTLTITDNVVWDVPAKQAGIAGVTVDPANDRMATITVSKDAQIGSATITAKTPKKSAKVTVKVSATLTGLKITNTEKELYSGQTLQMTYERTPAGNKDSIKWEIEKVNNKANPNATISGKGLLTIKPTVEDGATITVILKSPKKGQRAEFTAEKYSITVKQSSIDGITVMQTSPSTTTPNVAGVEIDNNRVVQNPKKAGTTELDIPVNGRYTIDVTLGSHGSTGLTKEIAVNTLTYKNNKPKVVDITRSTDGKLTITPKASGTAKITVSGIRATANAAGKVTGKAITTSFNVKVSQPVTTVNLDKPEIVLVEKKKSDGTYQDLKISGLKATFGPKQANKAAEKKIAKWEILKSGETDWITVPKSKTNSAPNTSASLSYTLATPKAGDVYTVKVTTATGLTRTSMVKVISPVTALVIADKQMSNTDSEPNTFKDTANNNKANQTTIVIGETTTMYPYVNIGTRTAADWKIAGDKRDGYAADEVVSYSVNKNDIVSINQKTGVIKAMKDGKVTITAKTATGKSAKLTVNVVLP